MHLQLNALEFRLITGGMRLFTEWPGPGTATVFPQAIALAAMFDDKKLKEIADVIAEEGRAKYHAFSREGDRDIYKGLTFWSPNVNIFQGSSMGKRT